MKSIPANILCFFLIVSTLATAQRIYTKTYTGNNGLQSVDVRALAQDSRGYIWFATGGGMSIYDGSTFRPRRYIDDPTAIARSRNGDILVWGMTDGKIAMEGRTYVSSLNLITEAEGSQKRPVLCVYLDSHRTLWAGIDGIGVVQIPVDSFLVISRKSLPRNWIDSLMRAVSRRMLSGVRVTRFAEDYNGSLWCATEKGLLKYNGADFVSPPGLPQQLKKSAVTALHVANDSTFWCGLRGQGAVNFNPLAYNRVYRKGIFPGRTISAVAEDLDGRVWFGFSAGGVGVLDGPTTRTYGVEDGILHGEVRSLTADREGNLWIATPNGATKIFRIRFERFTSFKGLDPSLFISACVDSQDRVWFGGKGGVVSFIKSTSHVHSLPDRFRTSDVRAIASSADGTLWMLAGNTVISYRTGRFRIHESKPLQDERFGLDLLINQKWGPVIIGHKAVYVVRGDSVREFRSFPDRIERAVSDHRGVLWITTIESVYRVDGSQVTALDQLHGGVVFETADRQLWAGAHRGFARIAKESPLELEWHVRADTTRYDWDPGDAFEGPDSRKFLITRTRVYELFGGKMEVRHKNIAVFGFLPRDIPATAMQRPYTSFWSNSFTRLNTRTGYFGASTPVERVAGRLRDEQLTVNWQRSAAVVDRAGNLWVPVSDGIGKFEPYRAPSAKPLCNFVAIDIGDEVIYPSSQSRYGQKTSTVSKELESMWYGEPSGGLTFENGDTVVINRINPAVTLRFNSLSFSDESDVRFTTATGDQDGEWTPPGKDRQASVGSLSSGIHTIRLRAIDGDGEVSDDCVIHLRVVDPFWATTWFISYTGVVFLYVGGRIYRRRIKALKERNKRETARAILANEMQMAQKIQMGMVPSSTPQIKGLQIAARTSPASEVGGDFYDFTKLRGDQTAICVGDVSGHGLTGAMIVGLARTSLRFAVSTRRSPAHVVTLANNRIYEDIKRNLFVAVFFGVIDHRKKTLTYTNAGQTMPILARAGKAEFLRYSPGDRFPLGIIQGSRYGEETLHLMKGDTLMLYTDGIVEMRNAAGAELGFDRLKEILARNAHRPAADIVEATFAEMRGHAGTEEQQDDITIIVLKVGGA